MSDDVFGDFYDDDYGDYGIYDGNGSEQECDYFSDDEDSIEDGSTGINFNGKSYYHGPIVDPRSIWEILAKPLNFHENWNSLLECRDDLSLRVDAPIGEIDGETCIESLKQLLKGYHRLLDNAPRDKLKSVDWIRTLGLIFEDIFPVLASLTVYSKYKKSIEKDLFHAYKESLLRLEEQGNNDLLTAKLSKNQQKKLLRNDIKAQLAAPLLLASSEIPISDTCPLNSFKSVGESVSKTDAGSLIKLDPVRVDVDGGGKMIDENQKEKEEQNKGVVKKKGENCMGPYTSYKIYIPNEWYHKWKLVAEAWAEKWP